MPFKLYLHQQELLGKAAEQFTNGRHSSVIVVSPAGSGKSIMIASITKAFTDFGGHVLFMVHRKELIDQITESLIDNEVDMSRVTILSVIKVKNRMSEIPKPGLIITDETHHSKAKTYMKIYEYFSDVPRIGFTATPVRLSGEGFDDIYDSMIVGKSVSWLINHNYLAPFRYYSLPLLDRKKLKKQQGEFTNKSISAALEGTTIFGEVLNTYLEKAQGQQAILYAHNVEYSKKYAAIFCEAGINAIHVDSKTPKAEREKIMNGFKDKTYQLLCNVDLISEGFNVPDCSTIILLRPTQSLTVFIQQSMRGMRYKPQKQSVIIDHVGNYLKHGLPNTEHLWSLQGHLEESDKEMEECPDCNAIFADWIWKSTELYSVKICPICAAEFWKEKEIQEIKKNEITSEKLEEISKEEIQILELKKIAENDHRRYSNDLLAITKIFIARNIIAQQQKKKKTYNYPIHFAIRQFLKLNNFSCLNLKSVYEQLEEIEDFFGEEYQVSAVHLMKYMKKIKSEHKNEN